MLKRCSLLVTVALSTATPALPLNMQNMEAAENLGNLLASEDMCGLSYDHDAIDAYVDANVDHTDMGFAGNLTSFIAMADMMLGDHSETARRAHCRAIEGTARHHGFID